MRSMPRPGRIRPASATITDFYSKNSPFDLLSKQTVDASVESIVQQSSKTYEVVWVDTIRDLGGEFVSSHRYRAFVSVTTQEVTDAKQALVNPIGLYVTNLTWGRSGEHRGRTNHKWRFGQMIWFAAMMMAAQATSGASGATAPPQPVPALTAQQKQELLTYNFKHARSSPECTDRIRRRKSQLRSLRFLHCKSRRSQAVVRRGNPSAVGASVDKGSAVPPGWKPPHAELNACSCERGSGFPSMGNRRRHAHAWQ